MLDELSSENIKALNNNLYYIIVTTTE